MKLLTVGSRVPYPVRDGGNVRSDGVLRELGRRHEVSYLCRADEPRPDAEWSETALANWAAVVNSRAKLIFEDSRIGPSEAYGGKRPAT